MEWEWIHNASIVHIAEGTLAVSEKYTREDYDDHVYMIGDSGYLEKTELRLVRGEPGIRILKCSFQKDVINKFISIVSSSMSNFVRPNVYYRGKAFGKGCKYIPIETYETVEFDSGITCTTHDQVRILTGMIQRIPRKNKQKVPIQYRPPSSPRDHSLKLML